MYRTLTTLTNSPHVPYAPYAPHHYHIYRTYNAPTTPTTRAVLSQVLNIFNNVAGAGVLTLAYGMRGVGWVPAISTCVVVYTHYPCCTHYT